MVRDAAGGKGGGLMQRAGLVCPVGRIALRPSEMAFAWHNRSGEGYHGQP
jgi:hypothetical protein